MATVKPSTWSKLDSNNEFLYKVAFIPARPNLAEDQRYLLAEFGARLCLSRLRRSFTAQQVADSVVTLGTYTKIMEVIALAADV